MTDEKALEILEMFLHKQCSLARTEFAHDAETVWHAVKKANEALENSRWIPVSERLPEERKRVLVYIDRPTNQICVSQRTDVTYWIGLGHVNVVAWMPLPEAYKGEEE